ncbi:MAG TPA: hypothetical protein VHZ55_35185 [Bryobacteraceae bacterium]|nr:hypothetical protein [Bryobacteraceae bacterium]
MLRLAAALLLFTGFLASCRNDLQSKEKVQAAILARLQKSTGLDLNSLDVNTTSVSFDRNLAYATVAFHPKGDPSVNSGMVMKYTLEQRDGQWAVVKVGDSQGHGLQGPGMTGHGGAGADQLPPGHPPLDGAAPDGGRLNPHASGTGQESPNGQVR